MPFTEKPNSEREVDWMGKDGVRLQITEFEVLRDIQ